MIVENIQKAIASALSEQFNLTLADQDIQLVPTHPEFEGAWTFVSFGLAKQLGKNPMDLASAIGNYLVKNTPVVQRFNVVKGFLNLVIDDKVWVRTLLDIAQNPDFEVFPPSGRRVMVEFSSPNTNKPLHLGHLRNNFLGWSLSEILKAAGDEVLRVNLVNDRGIHICKSMLAYQLFGNGEQPTPELKGDHLVGKYYVLFDQHYRAEVKQIMKELRESGSPLDDEELKEQAEKLSPLLRRAHDMLKQWEAGDKEILELWQKMNSWVLAGFEQTYRATGISFDKYYFESDTYLLGKEIVQEGLAKGVFYQKPDGSVWIDLRDEGLDEKLLQRSDGTSVYMTQDMGTADMKYADFPMDLSVYVVGNEQDYHFKVLSAILKRLGRPYADGVYHLSYGMVDLPTGKMKSREGTVVDADDLLAQMEQTARQRTEELGKIEGLDSQQAEELFHQLALGALKYFLLKVDPKKRMLFNPEESVDFQGNTGVYIQYNHAKISAILRKAAADGIVPDFEKLSQYNSLQPIEEELIMLISQYPQKLKEAAIEMNPAVIANYVYALSKLYSRFYSEMPIFGAQSALTVQFRVLLSSQTARIIRQCLHLLGIESPDRM